MMLCTISLVLPSPAAAAPPSNDNFASAQALTGSAPVTTGTNVEATKEVGEPNHNGNAGGASIWYSWTAPLDATVTMDTFGSGIDTVLAVYTGTGVGSLTVVTSNDDASGTPQSRVQFTAVKDTTYMVAVDGYNGVTGSISFAVNRPPANDAFAAAQVLNGETASDGRNTLNATLETGEPVHGGVAGGASVWYSWTAPRDSIVTINTAGSSYDTVLAAYTGIAYGSLVEVASNDDTLAAPPTSEISFVATSGVTYMIAVDGKAGATGTLALSLGIRPANDDLATGTIIAAAGGTVTSSSLRGTKEAGEPSHAGDAGGASVWYEWTPSTNEHFVIETTGSTFNTVLAVYTGDDMASLVPVGSNDDANSGLQSKVKLTSVSGARYRIAVDGVAGAAGTVTLTVRPAPLNDDFEDATTLSGVSPAVTQVLGPATSEVGEPGTSGTVSSVWYEWVAPYSGTVDLQASFPAAGGYYRYFYVYEGATLSTLTQRLYASVCDGCTNNYTFTATAGTTYHIKAQSDYTTVNHTIRLNWGNDFADASNVVGTSVTTGWNNVFTDAETGEPAHAGVAGGRSRWYAWTAPQTGTVVVNTFGSTFDTLLGVYTGATVGALTLVGSNDDAGGTLQSSVSVGVIAGTTYRIAIDGKAGATGSYTLRVRYPPVNDAYATPTALNAYGQSITGHNTGATLEAGEPIHAGVAGGASIWYEITPAGDGVLELDTVGTGFDTTMAIYGPYTGTETVDAIPLLGSNDDDGVATTSRISVSVTGGVTYRIAVDGKAGAVGDTTLNAALRPVNDHFANATILNGPSPAVTQQPLSATAETGEPGTAGTVSSVWYKWVAPYSGTVDLQASFPAAGSFYRYFYVYNGVSLGSLTQLLYASVCDGCTNNYTFTATAGTAYYIKAQSDYGNVAHTIRLNWGNDFADATTLTGLSATTSWNNVFTDAQTGEPDHAAVVGGRSKWYVWTATQDGTVFVDTYGSTFDTLLGIYTGGSVGALTQVAANDDAGGTLQSSLSFAAVNGTTYRIAIDGKAGAAGAYSLKLAYPPPPPVNDAFATPTALNAYGETRLGYTTAASLEAGEPNHAGVVGNASIWYEIRPADDGTLILDTAGSTFDTVLAVYGPYTATESVDTIPLLGSNDDNGAATSSRVSLTVTGGATYRIAIDGKGGTSGDTTLNATLRPLNDDFANARTLSGVSPVVSQVPLSATSETGEPGTSGTVSSVWYKWVAPYSGTVDLQASFPAAGAYYRYFYVYDGVGLGTLTQLLYAPVCDGCTNDYTFTATAGTTYYLKAQSDYGYVAHTIRLNKGNDFANAASLTGTSVTTGWNNVFTDAQTGEPDHAAVVGGRSKWYVWTAPQAGTVYLNTFGSAFDTMLGVYTGTSVGAVTEIASNDDAGGTLQSALTFTAAAGTTYRIAIDGKAGAAGSHTLRLRYPPVNDAFATPTALNAYGQTIAGSNIGGTKELNEPAHAGQPGGASIWYEITPADDGTLLLDTVGSNIDTTMAVYGPYTGTQSVDTIALLTSGDDTGGLTSSTASLTVTGGVTYRIAIDGKFGMTGDISLSATLRPLNDNFLDARAIDYGTTWQQLLSATSEPGEPGTAGTVSSVWYRFEAAYTGTVTTTLSFPAAGAYYRYFYVYGGVSLGSLNQLLYASVCDGCTNTYTFNVTAGTSYYIKAQSDYGYVAHSITLAQPPANDNFANAEAISGMRAQITGRTRGATKEVGEPNHDGHTGGRSVWYSWTAPESGNIVLDTFGSNFDSILSVYTGGSLGTLTQVAANTDAAGSEQSRLTFQAVAGTTYWFAVDGQGGGSGDVQLYLNRGPANDDFVNARVVDGYGAVTIGDSEGAISETGEPSHAGQPAGPSIWYEWTPAMSGLATIDTQGSSFDTTLGIYTGDSVGALTTVSSNDDSGANTWSSTTFSVTGGVRYRIAISGKSGASGQVQLNVLAPLQVVDVFPPLAEQGDVGKSLTVHGAGFVPGAVVTISGSDVTVTSATVVDSTRMSITVDVGATATTGLRSVTVTNPDLTTDTATDALEITSPDTTPPETTIDTGSTGGIVVGAQTQSWTFSASELSWFECRIDAGAWTVCTSPASYTVAEGSHTFEVRATDYGDNVDSTPAAATFTVDLTAPTPDPAGSGTADSPTQITWSANGAADAPAGLHATAYSFDGGATWQASSTFIETGLASNTIYTRDIRVRDAVGNVTGPSAVKVRTLAVAPSVAADQATGTWLGPGLVTITFTNGAAWGAGGVEYYRVALTSSSTHTWSGTENVWSSGSLAIQPVAGQHYLHVRSYNADHIGGASATLGEFWIDPSAPAPDPPTVTTASTADSVTITVDPATDPHSGLHAQAYSFDNGVTWQTSNVLSTSALGPNETVSAQVIVRDALGNMTAATSASATTDPVAPAVSATPAPSGAWQADGVLVTLSSSVAFGPGTLSSYRVKVSQLASDSVTSSDQSWTSGTFGVLLSGTSANWYIHVRSFNSAGQGGATQSVGAYMLDATAPPSPGPIAAESPTALAPQLSWATVTDNESGLAGYRIYRSTSSGTLGSLVATPGAATTTWSDPDGSLVDGQTYYYTVAPYDQVNNERFSGNPQVAITFSSTTPSGTSILIQGGASATASQNVTLTLAATNATEMLIDDRPDLATGTWQPMQGSIAWVLAAGDGPKTLYARFRGSNLVESATVTATILLDTTSPTANPPVATTSAVTQTGISWEMTAAGDAGVGLAASPYSFDDGATWQSSTSLVQSGLAPNTTYTRLLRAVDAIGNVTAQGSASATTLPAGPAISSVPAPDAVNSQPLGETITFTNDAGFGPGAIAYYRWAWTESTTHAFAGTEPMWSSGTLTRQQWTAGTFYLHVLAYSSAGQAGQQIAVGPYIFAPPTASQTVHVNVGDAQTLSCTLTDFTTVLLPGVFDDATVACEVGSSIAGWHLDAHVTAAPFFTNFLDMSPTPAAYAAPAASDAQVGFTMSGTDSHPDFSGGTLWRGFAGTTQITIAGSGTTAVGSVATMTIRAELGSSAAIPAGTRTQTITYTLSPGAPS